MMPHKLTIYIYIYKRQHINLKKMSQVKDEMLQSKKMKIVKKSNLRDIMNIKSLMDKRKEQRSSTLYNLAIQKYQNALIIARQLLFTSQKIWKQFHDQYIEEFEQNLFFRTSKNKEHTQYLLDSVLICKVFVKSKKKDDIMELIQKIEIPDVHVIDKSQLVNREVIYRYNQMKEILSRTCAALLSFIQITKLEKNNQYTEKLFTQYIKFVKKYYGPLEYATATFIFANHLYQQKQYRKAVQMHQICLSIRKQNCLNEAFVDVLVNSAICKRQLGQIADAIERMKFAIEVSKDLKKSQQSIIDDYHLFLAKLQLQNGDFADSYKNYQITYKLREKLDSQDPKRIQIQLNLLYFYKMLQKIVGQNSEQCFNIKDRKQVESRRKQAHEVIKEMTNNIFNREQFAKFDDFNKKMAHLNLVVTQSFFDLLSAEQVNQLNGLLQKLGSCSFQKGVSQLFKCSFFQEKKTRELLLLSNPLITKSPNQRQ